MGIAHIKVEEQKNQRDKKKAPSLISSIPSLLDRFLCVLSFVHQDLIDWVGPECSRAQAPHLRLAVRGPGARFQPGGVRLALDHHNGDITLARRQAANHHLASCEAEEEVLCQRAGKWPCTRALVARRKRSRERRGF